MLRTLGIAGGACALLAGAVVAGTAAHAAPEARAAAPAAAPASAPLAADAADAAALALDGADAGADGTAADGARRELLCARVPNAIVRTEAREKRLAADASTPGSLAWLRTKVDEAKAANRTELATVLENRLEFRTALAQFLPQRLALLQKAQSTVCAPDAAPAPATS